MKHTPETFILFSGKKDAEKNDNRFKYLSEQLIGDGKKVFIFNKNSPDILGEAITRKNIAEITKNSFAVILSFFLTPDEKVEILSALPDKSSVFGGTISDEETALCAKKSHVYKDLLNDELFCRENAIPTAEAALSTAINETPFTLRGKNALIIGYGRVAKETAFVFRAIGMNTVCAVRRKELFNEIKEKGHGSLLIDNGNIFDVTGKYSLKDFHIAINTVPPPGIITKKHAADFCPDVLFIDLAPCETVNMLTSLGLKAVNAPSLPGRISPQSGAEYIYNAVESHYK